MRTSGKKQMAGWVVVVFFCVALGGCITLQGKSKNKSDTTASKPAAGQRYEPQKPTSVYYDFQDVLFPVELKLDRKKSSVYVTDGFKTGILSLSGNVETRSMITWFENNMVKDNWRLVGSLKAKRTMLLFVKQNRYCVISVTAGMMKSYVEVWMAPTINDIQGAGRLQ